MNFIFEDSSDKTKEEQEALYEALTEKALSGEHTAFEYIKSVSERSVMLQALAGLETVIKLYDVICKDLYKAYCKQILAGDADFNLIYVLRQNIECKVFYEKEYEIAFDMLDEYKAYVRSGHFLDQWLFLHTRETWHLWDHRKENPFGN